MRAALTVSRRTTITITTVVLVSAGAAACDLDPPRDDGGPARDAPVDADSLLVASVLSAIVSAEAVVAAAAEASPRLGRRLGPLAASHAAHRALLAVAAPDAATDPPSAVDPWDSPAAALGAVRGSEARLQRTAIEACVDASSGDLARVLASLGASTSQHLAALDADTRAAS